jgi:hypothetical protein
MLDSKYLPKMKVLSTVDLLDITTQRRDEYESEALECAENEIRNRNLTDEEMQYAQAELQSIVEGRFRKRERIKKMERGVYEAIGVLNPLVSRTTLVTIKSISILFLLSHIWFLCSGYRLFIFLIQTFPRWNFGDKIFLLQVFWIPIACYGFIRIRKFGWKMFHAWAVFNSSLVVSLLISQIHSYIVNNNEDDEFYGMSFGYIRDTPPRETYLPLVTLVGAFIWFSFLVYLNLPKTRVVYDISRRDRRLTFILPVLFTLYMIVYDYFFSGYFY